MSAIAGQLDLLALLEPEVEPTNQSELVGFTFYEANPDKLDVLHLAWSSAYHDSPWNEWRKFPGWHECVTGRNVTPNSLHPSFTYWADIRCNHWDKRLCVERESDPCQCVGNDLLYRVYCSGCDWWTPISDRENGAVEMYLDHCWPGWHDLPVIESKPRGAGTYSLPIPADYPEAWKQPGAPIRDCRGNTRHGGRHVPAGSPFGGFKAATIRDCEAHNGR